MQKYISIHHILNQSRLSDDLFQKVHPRLLPTKTFHHPINQPQLKKQEGYPLDQYKFRYKPSRDKKKNPPKKQNQKTNIKASAQY
jgi:hypothetical protein